MSGDAYGGDVSRTPSGLLTLEIEFPGFFVSAGDTDEDAEIGMHLASEEVVVVFMGHEGDQPGTMLRSLEGHIRSYRVAVR